MNRDLWQQAAERAPQCPSTDQWAAYVAEEVPAENRRTLDDHRRGCPACEAELALLTSFLQAQPTPDEAADLALVLQRTRLTVAPAPPWWQAWFAPSTFRAWALAAAAFAMVALGLQWRSGALPPVIQHASDEMRSAPAVEDVTPNGDLREAPRRISWRKVDGASNYQVQILAVDGSELWRSPLTNQVFHDELPTGDVFAARRTVAIRVTALAADGKPLAVSPDVRLRVTPLASGKN